MLIYVMRPSDDSPFPVYTRFGGLGQNLRSATNRAAKCGGRVYSTDGHSVELLADFGDLPQAEVLACGKPELTLTRREYWAARNQAAIFA